MLEQIKHASTGLAVEREGPTDLLENLSPLIFILASACQYPYQTGQSPSDPSGIRPVFPDRTRTHQHSGPRDG